MIINSKYISILLYFFPLAVLQVILVPYAAFQGVVPDLLIILLVVFTLRYGQIYGTVAGFVLGFLFDLISGGLIGAFMFSKTLTCFLIGYIYNENKVDDYLYSYMFVLVVLAAAIIDSLIYSMIILTETGFNLFELFFLKSLLPGIYTAAVSVPFLLLKKRKGLL